MNIAPQSFTPLQVTTRELAVLVAEMVGYTGTLKFDTTRLDGAPRKLLDLSRLRALGWIACTPLREGLPTHIRIFWFIARPWVNLTLRRKHRCGTQRLKLCCAPS